MLNFLALALAFGATLACYLTSEHQHLLPRRWRARSARAWALVGAVLSLAGWCMALGASAGIAAAFTALAAGAVFWPYAGVGVLLWRRVRHAR